MEICQNVEGASSNSDFVIQKIKLNGKSLSVGLDNERIREKIGFFFPLMFSLLLIIPLQTFEDL